MPLTAFTLISLSSPCYSIGWDYKIQPGSTCQPVDGRQAGNLVRYPSYLLNNSQSIVSVVCPLVRDTSYQATIDMGIWVASGGGNLQCLLQTSDYVGGNVKIIGSYNQPFGSTNTLAHPHYFSLSQTQTFWSGPYEIQCILPPKSKIFYSVSGEYANTDNGF